MKNKLSIYEHFYSFQGEGDHMGMAAYFVRTYGCPIRCPWCDSKGTWHKDYQPSKLFHFTNTEIVELVSATNCSFVVITGGEPAVHDLSILVDDLHKIKKPVHIETSGAYSIKGSFDWITVSPKRWKLPLPINLEKANEIKLIIEDESSFAYWMDYIQPYIQGKSVWLHPEWSQVANLKLLKHISETVKEYGASFRAGFQLHKLYKVD